ncbi:MAG TPA: 2,3-bisphosphoglycerate-independent phosphoglycerate mutase [Gammaproteobacteria bacterium]|nr:2,3-bisphosphoglycerate-independent phosphoglycerate mutase [Gammaproteobacteria bacterium]
MAQVPHPVLLVVLDGWGYTDETRFNAIHAARTPHWDSLWQTSPHTLIRCSGLDVGLPDDQMGNSEVGHMHLGAGRLVYQDYTRISKAITDGDFFTNPVLRDAFELAAKTDRAVHLLGLLSPGGVHSHETHTVALIDFARRCGVRRLYIHAFLDGRDMPPKSAAPSIAFVEDRCTALGLGRIASLVGRYYAMDRNKTWERVQVAYALIVDGLAQHHAPTPLAGLEAAYARGETDEFVTATTIGERVRLEDGDVVVFTNFRADRARQLTSALTAADFPHFPRARVPRLGRYVTMTDYGAQFHLPIAFPTVDLSKTFGEIVAAHGLRQLRIAETEKYAHVTFFFNGGQETPFPGEDRILVPSPKVATYDLKPEMSAIEVTDKLVAAIESREYDALICNYANADMVGHTGVFEAAVRCIETLDACLGRLVDACRRTGTEMLITADHGNAEQMRATPEATAEPHTAHTSNLVPLVYFGRAADIAPSGTLSDVAPTLLALLGLPQPAEMTGKPLVQLKAAARHAVA